MKPSVLLSFAELVKQYPNANIEIIETRPPQHGTSLTSKATHKEHMSKIGSGSARARKLPTGGNVRFNGSK
jgi:hypothetical protein